MQTKEKTINKESQRTVLKLLCEKPTYGISELSRELKDIPKDEISAIIQGVNPAKSWNVSSEEEVRFECLNYIWNIEAQILFIFPIKQKDNTLLDINQMRLSKGQSKITKDLVRTLTTNLQVEGKRLVSFRKFVVEKNLVEDVDTETMLAWAARQSLFEHEVSSSSVSDLSASLFEKVKSDYSSLVNKHGSESKRVVEKFVENYFSGAKSSDEIKSLVENYKNIYKAFKDADGTELSLASESQKQNKLIEDVIEKLSEIKDAVEKNTEGGLGKFISGKSTNKNGVIGLVNEAIDSLNDLNQISRSANNTVNEKALSLQKVQNDLEATLLLKGKLELDLSHSNDKLKTFNAKYSDLERELNKLKSELHTANKEIKELKEKNDQYTSIEVNNQVLRDDLALAKDISLKLQARLDKLKDDIKSKAEYVEPTSEESISLSEDSTSTEVSEEAVESSAEAESVESGSSENSEAEFDDGGEG